MKYPLSAGWSYWFVLAGLVLLGLIPAAILEYVGFAGARAHEFALGRERVREQVPKMFGSGVPKAETR